MNEKEEVCEIVKNLLELLEFDAKIEILEDQSDNLVFAINSKDSQLLIGHHGVNLLALEYLVHSISRVKGINIRFSLDINNYKKQREDILVGKALDIVKDVLKNKRPIVLRPMNSYERRLIHKAIQQEDGVTTESIGEKSERKVVIKPMSEIN